MVKNCISFFSFKINPWFQSLTDLCFRVSDFFVGLPVADPAGTEHEGPGAGVGPKESGDDASPCSMEDALIPDYFNNPSKSNASKQPSKRGDPGPLAESFGIKSVTGGDSIGEPEGAVEEEEKKSVLDSFPKERGHEFEPDFLFEQL